MDCVDGSDENRCSINGCEPNEFRCQNKKCILKIWRCDGDYDCDDKSDEQDCDRLNEINGNDMGTPCSNYQFYCQRDNKCIPRSYHCDTHRDCSDGSDEVRICFRHIFLNRHVTSYSYSRLVAVNL